MMKHLREKKKKDDWLRLASPWPGLVWPGFLFQANANADLVWFSGSIKIKKREEFHGWEVNVQILFCSYFCPYQSVCM